MTDQSTASEKNGAQESAPTPGGAPSEGEPITRQERNERWFEVATGIVLAIVAVAAAWSGYQSARWGGVQSERYTQASAKRVESTRASTLAGQHTLYDLNLFNQWLNAHAAETAQLAQTYEQRFRPARFWRYRIEHFAGADDLFDPGYQPGGTQPPVFKPEHAHRNILVRPDATRDEIETVLSATPDGKHHKWFRSMSSSQALAQSVFANLKRHDKLGLLAGLRGEDRLPIFPASVARARYFWKTPLLELECRVDTLAEPRPTSVDVMFDGQYRVAVECKLSEPEVGSCSRPGLGPSDSNFESDHCDGSYTRQRGRRERCALTERGIAYWRYIPKLFTWPADGDMRPCPLHATYQLVRNILAAYVRPNGDLDLAAHAVLLYDARNPGFAEGGKGHLAWQAVRSALKNAVLLRRCTWQELVACLRQDAGLDWLTNALRSKYGL
jgi:Restriction Endonuclease associating with ARP